MPLRRRADGRSHGEVAADAAKALPPDRPIVVEPDPEAAAFFDVDNTILQGASLFHFARGMYQRDLFGTRDIVKGAWAQLKFMLGSENQDDIDEARASALGLIRGKHVEEIQRLAEEIYDESMEPRIWPGTRAIAQLHIEQGQRVWLVTAAPIEIASVIASRLGLTGAMGTVAERVDGVYTGRLVGDLLHGQAKVDAVLALAEKEGLDLARCSAYSDSANDIPLLSLVGNPCAINPDRELRAHAMANGWRIRDYRAGQKRVAAAAGAVAAGAVVGAATATGIAVARRIRAA